MIRYKLFQDTREGSKTEGKWYARAAHELMEFEEFITHLANHHCAFSEANLRGVLTEMLECLRELLLEGKAVRLGDLGIFRIGLKTEAADTAKKFNAAQNITGARLNLYLGKRFIAKELYADMKVKEADNYSVDKEDAADDPEGE